MRGLFVVVLALLAHNSVDAMFFHVTEGSKRCFIEEVPEGTLVLGTYKSPDQKYDPSAARGREGGVLKARDVSGVRISVTDPFDKLVLEMGAEVEGRFAFTSIVAGEHQICLSPNTTHWFGPNKKMRFELDVQVGALAIDYNEVARIEHLSDTELSIRKLNDMIDTIKNEQKYQRDREETMRNTNESTNTRVLWWSIAQTMILVILGVWQIWHLKAFFRDKLKYV